MSNSCKSDIPIRLDSCGNGHIYQNQFTTIENSKQVELHHWSWEDIKYYRRPYSREDGKMRSGGGWSKDKKSGYID